MLNDSIQVFLKVVEKKSFSKAAKDLFLTQPAVSFQIQMLEEHYGTRLLERFSRNVMMTEAGELLYKYATEISAMQERLEGNMKALNTTTIGRLKIGASNTIGDNIIPYILGSFKKRYPKVTVILEVGNSDEIEMAVHNTSLDVGLVEGPPIGKDLETVPYVQDELVVVTRSGHPWTLVGSISIFDLDDYPFISRERGSGTRAEIKQHLKDAGFPVKNLDVFMHLGSTMAIKSALQDGHAFSILSKWAVRDEVRDGRLAVIPLKETRFTREFRVVTHKKKFHTQAAEVFLDYVKKENPQI